MPFFGEDATCSSIIPPLADAPPLCLKGIRLQSDRETDLSLSQRTLLYLCTFLSIFALYAPQPLQPELGRMLGVGPEKTALFVGMTQLLMGVIPFLFGWLADSFNPRRLLLVCLPLLGLCQLPLCFPESYDLILGSRLLQGAVTPLILTAVMTYISTLVPPDKIRPEMARYIAITVAGGFSGRFSSGPLTAFWGLPSTFVLLLLGTGILSLLVLKLKPLPPRPTERLTFQALQRILRTRDYQLSYAFCFLAFFVFSGTYNFLPYRLEELDPEKSLLLASLFYTSYLIGVFVSLASTRLMVWFGSLRRLLWTGLVAWIGLLASFYWNQLGWFLLGICLFCGLFFAMHSQLAGHVNALGNHRRGTVNGFYVSFYYLGGAVGGSLPGPFYVDYGWEGMLVIMLAAVLLGIAILLTQPQFGNGRHDLEPASKESARL